MPQDAADALGRHRDFAAPAAFEREQRAAVRGLDDLRNAKRSHRALDREAGSIAGKQPCIGGRDRTLDRSPARTRVWPATWTVIRVSLAGDHAVQETVRAKLLQAEAR